MSDWRKDSPYLPLYNQWFPMHRRAANREDCKVLFPSYLEFKKWALSNGWVKGLCVCRTDDKGNYSSDNARIDTRASNNIEKSAKTFFLISPEGNPVEVYNMTDFCKGTGLDRSCMTKLGKGKRESHKGWTRWVK